MKFLVAWVDHEQGLHEETYEADDHDGVFIQFQQQQQTDPTRWIITRCWPLDQVPN